MKFSNSLFICAVLGLSGCGASHDFSDLQAYMDEVRARPKGSIEPLPKFQPYESFTYSAASMRNPFQPPIKIDMTKASLKDSLLWCNMMHTSKEPVTKQMTRRS